MSPTSFVNVVMWCEEKSKLVCWCMNLESSALNPVFCVVKKYAAVFSIDRISFHWEVEIDLFINTKLFEKTLIEYIFYWIHWIIKDACPCPSPENFQDCPAPPRKCPEFNCYPAPPRGFYSLPCPTLKIAWLSLCFILETSWVALYSVVCEYVRHRCHPTKSLLFPIDKGIQALCWPCTT